MKKQKKMYLTIIYLPLITAIVVTMGGRVLGQKWGGALACIGTGMLLVLSIIATYEVCIGGSPVILEIGPWTKIYTVTLGWGLYIDSLSTIMLTVISSISLCVQVYSTEYMKGDPHLPRFMGYLSAFTGFMVVLVTAPTLVQLFVGWEGILKCLKWKMFNFSEINAIKEEYLLYTMILLKNKPFKIGPHNIDVLSFIVGSVLGDSHLEKRGLRGGVRVKFEQCSANVEYLMMFHKFLSSRTYCNSVKPKLKTRISKNNERRFFYTVNSYTFTSLKFLHDLFYINKKKVIKKELSIYLTPLSLAIWFMDDGSKIGSTVRIATNNFETSEVYILCKILKEKYDLNCSVQKAGGTYTNSILYIKKDSVQRFYNLIKPYMVKSMLYKFPQPLYR